MAGDVLVSYADDHVLDETSPSRVCASCWEYWPCTVAQQSARVVALERALAAATARAEAADVFPVMLDQACEAVRWLLEGWPADENPGPGIRTDLVRWRAALAAAAPGDGGEAGA